MAIRNSIIQQIELARELTELAPVYSKQFPLTRLTVLTHEISQELLILTISIDEFIKDLEDD